MEGFKSQGFVLDRVGMKVSQGFVLDRVCLIYSVTFGWSAVVVQTLWVVCSGSTDSLARVITGILREVILKKE